jgi:hypothetical protein
LINAKSTLAGLPPRVWDHTERVLHRGRLSDLPGNPKSLNLRRQYRHPVNAGLKKATAYFAKDAK